MVPGPVAWRHTERGRMFWPGFDVVEARVVWDPLRPYRRSVIALLALSLGEIVLRVAAPRALVVVGRPRARDHVGHRVGRAHDLGAWRRDLAP